MQFASLTKFRNLQVLGKSLLLNFEIVFINRIADCSLNNYFRYKINCMNSIFTAEAWTISMALDELTFTVSPIIIFTISLSVINTLQYVTWRSPRVIILLHNKIQRVSDHNWVLISAESLNIGNLVRTNYWFQRLVWLVVFRVALL